MEARLEKFREFLKSEARAIESVPVTQALILAADKIEGCTGKLLTTGIGKAGFIARKAASTFSTTGSPSLFVHPAESAHGDAGVFSSGDIVLAYSNSGKTREVIETVRFARSLGAETIIAMTSQANTPLGEEADIVLELGTIEEACPFKLTPTSSAAAMLAVSDALALSIMESRGFQKSDWAQRHHGGYLGVKSRE